MKNLGQFFDYKRFLEGKKFAVTEITDAIDYDTKKPVGKTVEVACVEDKTVYQTTANGKVIDNLYEKMKVKVLDASGGYVDAGVTRGTVVRFGDFTKFNLYIDKSGFLQLTIECKSIPPELPEVVKPDNKDKVKS